MKMRNGSVPIRGIVFLVICAVALIVGLVARNKYTREKAEAERVAREQARMAQIERERLEHERQRKEAEELQRKEREAKQALETARLAKEKAEREAEEVRRREQEAKEAAVRDYRAALALFSKPFQLVSRQDAAKLPFGDGCHGTYWCVFKTYAEDHLVYRMDFKDGRATVRAMAPEAHLRNVSEGTFKAMYDSAVAAVTDGKTLWLKGVKQPGGLYDIPPREKDFRILDAHLGSFAATFAALGMEAPRMAFRVTLKSNSGKTSTALGVFDASDVVDREKIDAAAAAAIGKKLTKNSGRAATVKRRRVKQTVVIYDGVLIKKDMLGVTYVPREYAFHGTRQKNATGKLLEKQERAEREYREKWEKLCAEAERQAKEVAAAEAEYKAACEEAAAKADAKRREIEETASSEATIDAALAKCKLLVEPRKSAKK